MPDYEILDPILHAYVEDDKTIAEILAMEIDGADPETVQRVCRLVDILANSSASKPRSAHASPCEGVRPRSPSPHRQPIPRVTTEKCRRCIRLDRLLMETGFRAETVLPGFDRCSYPRAGYAARRQHYAVLSLNS